MYFELDGTGQLNEYQDRKELSAHVLSLSIGPIPEGRVRSKYLVSSSSSLSKFKGLNFGSMTRQSVVPTTLYASFRWIRIIALGPWRFR